MSSSVAYQNDDSLSLCLTMRGSRISTDEIQRMMIDAANMHKQSILTIGGGGYQSGGISSVIDSIKVPCILCTAARMDHQDNHDLDNDNNMLSNAQLDAQLDSIEMVGADVAEHVEAIREQVSNMGAEPTADTPNPFIESMKAMMADAANVNEAIQEGVKQAVEQTEAAPEAQEAEVGAEAEAVEAESEAAEVTDAEVENNVEAQEASADETPVTESDAEAEASVEVEETADLDVPNDVESDVADATATAEEPVADANSDTVDVDAPEVAEAGEIGAETQEVGAEAEAEATEAEAVKSEEAGLENDATSDIDAESADITAEEATVDAAADTVEAEAVAPTPLSGQETISSTSPSVEPTPVIVPMGMASDYMSAPTSSPVPIQSSSSGESSFTSSAPVADNNNYTPPTPPSNDTVQVETPQQPQQQDTAPPETAVQNQAQDNDVVQQENTPQSPQTDTQEQQQPQGQEQTVVVNEAPKGEVNLGVEGYAPPVGGGDDHAEAPKIEAKEDPTPESPKEVEAPRVPDPVEDFKDVGGGGGGEPLPGPDLTAEPKPEPDPQPDPKPDTPKVIDWDNDRAVETDDRPDTAPEPDIPDSRQPDSQPDTQRIVEVENKSEPKIEDVVPTHQKPDSELELKDFLPPKAPCGKTGPCGPCRRCFGDAASGEGSPGTEKAKQEYDKARSRIKIGQALELS